MSKVNKQDLAQALLALYQGTVEFNRIGGKPLHPDLEDSQKEVTLEECLEALEGLVKSDKILLVDGLIDTLITASFMQMIIDKNDSLSREHLGYFNVEGKSKEVLAGNLLTAILKEKWIDVVEIAEDLLYITDENCIANVYEILESNFSKYVPCNLIDSPEDMCEAIESEGRYTGVEYFTEKLSSGQEVYVFTAVYDTKNKKSFSKPKIVKSKGFFKEPQLIIN